MKSTGILLLHIFFFCFLPVRANVINSVLQIQKSDTVNLDSLSQNKDIPQSQEHGGGQINKNETPSDAENKSAVSAPALMDSYNYYLSLAVLCFGLLIISMGIYVLNKSQTNVDGSIKFVTITLIIISSLFLIPAGFSDGQIAPAFGLLGTLAGYIFGRASVEEKKSGNT